MIDTPSPSQESNGKSHNGRELELMLSGRKPFAIFEEAIFAIPTSSQLEEFDRYVRSGQVIRHVREDLWESPREVEGRVVLGTRQSFYALSAESWRIQAYLHLIEAVEGRQWNDAVEAFVCRLLGYSKAETAAWIDNIRQRYGGWGAVPAFLPLVDVDMHGIEALGLKAIPPALVGPKLLVFQEAVPDFKLLCSNASPRISAVARIGVAGSFFLKLKTEDVEGVRAWRFDGSLIPEINRSLRRDIELFPIGATTCARLSSKTS